MSKSKFHITLLPIAFLILLTISVLKPVKASQVSIWTDKADYSPEQTVLISGSSFLADSSIQIDITRPDSIVNSWTITSDSAQVSALPFFYYFF